jgi:hypothetical protein
MATKSRESIYGSSIRASAERAEAARKEAADFVPAPQRLTFVSSFSLNRLSYSITVDSSASRLFAFASSIASKTMIGK